MNIRRTASYLACISGAFILGSAVMLHRSSNGLSETGTVLAADIDLSNPTEVLPTDRSPERYQGSFFYSSSAQMLDSLGVKVYPEDKVYAFPDPKLGIGSAVQVFRAQPVVITDGDDSTLVRTWAGTVGDALAESRISLGDKDIVEPSQQTPIAVGSQAFAVKITRVAESQVTVKQSIDYTVTYEDDNTLEKGKTQVKQAGHAGTLTKTYVVRRENGKEVSRNLTSSTVTDKPVAQVVLRGTKVIDYGSGKASWYGGVGEMTAAHRTLPIGTQVRVVNVANGKSVVVRIADRGPFVAGRIVDLSKDAYQALSSLGSGVINVRIEQP